MQSIGKIGGLAFSTSVILAFLFVSTISAGMVNYLYDDLDRLTCVDYENGTVVEYDYDEVGNRILLGIYKPPAAEFSAHRTAGTLPLLIHFVDETVNNPTSWQWTLGDGNTSKSQDPSHIYANRGAYTVRLTAGNPSGSDTRTKTEYISVQPCQYPHVKIQREPEGGYASVQSAYNAAANGDTIRFLAVKKTI